MKTLIFIVSFAFALPVSAQDLGLSPSSVKLKVYKFAVSKDELCSDPTVVIDNGSSPEEVDFVSLPQLGKGKLDKGTYPCVIVEFADVIKFVPSTTSGSGNCVANSEYSLDVCRVGSNTKLVNGSTSSCANGENRVAMYLSTASTSGPSSDVFNPPTTDGDSSHGLNLGNALKVSGSTAGKFVVDGSGQVCDTADAGCDGSVANSCEMMPPTFTFSQE